MAQMRECIVMLLLAFIFCSGCTLSESETEAVRLLETKMGGPEIVISPSPSSIPTPNALPEAALTQEEEAMPPPLTNALICIDPGHGITSKTGQSPISPLSNEMKAAYVSGTTGAILTEEQLNLIVGLKLRDALEMIGAEVIMTREVSEIALSNVERSEIANQSGADVCVRIHADGSTNTEAKGVSVLVPAGDLLGTPSIVDESRRLGELMVNAVAETTGAKNRGTIDRSDLTGFNFSEVPTVLIEMGFMTNPEEDALLSTDEYQDKIVDGIVNSLLKWYGANMQ